MFEIEIEGKKYNSYQARGAGQYKFALFPEAPFGNKSQDLLYRLAGGKQLKELHGNFFYFSQHVFVAFHQLKLPPLKALQKNLVDETISNASASETSGWYLLFI